MAAPVWVLSVDLQTKTATFVTGMADAAKSARSAFSDIKSSAQEGGEGVSKSAINAQQALGVLTNALRGDVENALADIIRELSHTSIVMAALPIAATVGAIGLLVNIAVEVGTKIKEWREEQQKLDEETKHFDTTVNESFQGLDDRILQASQKTDELRNDHLGALRKELELIDHASMQDLVKELETIAKAADPVFKMLEGNWYTFGKGSEGAQHALETFKTQYDFLLSQGKDGDAADLLKGTRASAERVLEAQKAMQGSVKDGGAFGKAVDYSAQYTAMSVLQQAKIGYTEKDTKSQEALVQALNAQITAEGKIAELKKIDSGNATKQTGNEDSARRSEAARAAAASQLAIQAAQLSADKSYADATLTITNASVAQRLQSDMDFAQRDMDIKMSANQADIAALDKSGKDYQNQRKALLDKQLEIEAQYAASVAGLQSRAIIEQNQRDLANMEQAEREKINATQQGSAERLAAIDEAIKDAESRSLQETDYYRQLGSQRVDAVRQAAQDEAKLKADAGKEATDNTLRMGQLQLAAEQQQQAVADSARRMTDQQRVTEDLALSDKEFALKRQSLQQQAAALDTSAKDYTTKLQVINDKELQLIREHENEVNAIKGQSIIQQNERMKRGLAEMENGFAQSALRVVAGQQTLAGMLGNVSQQIVSNVIQAAIAEKSGLESTKLDQASAAARAMYLAGTKFPFPTNIVAAPLLGAVGFAAMMAFEGGGVVPGVGRGDIVPAMLTPGEGVVPGGVMDGLRDVARNGGFGGNGQTVHVHVRPVYNLQALDGKGIDRTLKNHTGTLTKHFNAQVRRMNK